ncbi:unnamed protein product [Diamesa serratosioi]
MFSLCPKFTGDRACQQSCEQHQVQQMPNGSNGKQIKGGYLLRYKKHIFWASSWVEEWVVLYDDSTMAWFTEPGKASSSGKILVKDAPEMLAIAHWTGQIPRRPPIPEGCSVNQLIALGSRRKRSKVYWMIAQSEKEVSEWIAAITKTLPPPPQIELVVDKPHLMGVLRRPIVRIRPSSNSEVLTRKQDERQLPNSVKIKSEAPIAIIKKSLGNDSMPKGSLTSTLPWGYGWGWVTLPNGIWNGALTWSQCEEYLTLQALPSTDCTNIIEGGGEVFNHIGHGAHMETYETAASSAGIDDLSAEDYDYAVDCGDFIF